MIDLVGSEDDEDSEDILRPVLLKNSSYNNTLKSPLKIASTAKVISPVKNDSPFQVISPLKVANPSPKKVMVQREILNERRIVVEQRNISEDSSERRKKAVKSFTKRPSKKNFDGQVHRKKRKEEEVRTVTKGREKRAKKLPGNLRDTISLADTQSQFNFEGNNSDEVIF